MRDVHGWVINLLVADLEKIDGFLFASRPYLQAKSIEGIDWKVSAESWVMEKTNKHLQSSATGAAGQGRGWQGEKIHTEHTQN